MLRPSSCANTRSVGARRAGPAPWAERASLPGWAVLHGGVRIWNGHPIQYRVIKRVKTDVGGSSGNGSRAAQASKYDAQNTVLSKTYGALADLRRELSDSRAVVGQREELLLVPPGLYDETQAVPVPRRAHTG